MALSRITKIAPGGTNTFAVNFALGYGNEADVTARVGVEVNGLGEPVYREIDFSVSGFMTCAGSAISAGTAVVFERSESRDELDVDWLDGANITDDNLNKAQLQGLRLVHEALDGRFEEITQPIDMNGKRILRVQTPVDPGDATNKLYVDEKFATEVPAIVDEMEALAETATTGATTATTQAGIATDKAALTSADRVATGEDRTQTGLDRVATAADRVQTGLDKAATAADRVQTGLDKIATAADKTSTIASMNTTSGYKTDVLGYRTEIIGYRSDVQADKVIAGQAADTAVGAQVATEAARDQMMALYANFDSRYLGPKATDPTVDNDGGTLVGGALYFDTTAGAMKVYTGTIWVAAYVSGTSFAALANNGSDYNATTFRTNLDLYSTTQVNTLITGAKALANATGVIPDGNLPSRLRITSAFVSGSANNLTENGVYFVGPALTDTPFLGNYGFIDVASYDNSTGRFRQIAQKLNGAERWERWSNVAGVYGAWYSVRSDKPYLDSTYASAAQGAKADTAVQPAGIANMVTSTDAVSIVKLTQAAYDALGSKVATTLYLIVG